MSEARLLKVADVDIENGVLAIHHSKKDNSRLVTMSDCLTERCRNFSKIVHPNSVAEAYYFPAFAGKPMTNGNIYKNFRKFLLDQKVSEAFFEEKACTWREEQKKIMIMIEALQNSGQTYFNEGILAQSAGSLFMRQSAHEKRRLLNFMVSNCIWKDGLLTVNFKKPFDMLSKFTPHGDCTEILDLIV